MSKRRRPESDEEQLYGRETELIDNHGPADPGPDPDDFPTTDDRPRGTEASGPGSEESHREPVRRRRARNATGDSNAP